MLPGNSDVVCVGSMFNNDVLCATALEQQGVRCCILRHKNDPALQDDLIQGTYPEYLKSRVIVRESAVHALSVFRNAKAVFSSTAAILSHLGPLANFLEILPLPPVFNLTTGSDINELAIEHTGRGRLFRRLLRHSHTNFLHPYTQALKNVSTLKLNNYIPIRYPYLLPQRKPDKAVQSGPIQYLHPTNLDWGQTDNKPGRVSTRGNDRFLRAFFRSVEQGANIHCTILDRGSDKEIAKQMVRKIGLESRFTWLSPQTPTGLRELILKCDIVADAFDVGAFGSIALESMIQGKPVMTFIDAYGSSLIYDVPPPVLNVHSEEEIFNSIISHQNRDVLQALGNRAYEWAKSNHSPSPDARLIAHMIRAAGNIPC